MDRHPALGQIPPHDGFQLQIGERQRAVGKHGVSVLLEIAFYSLALILEIACGLGEVQQLTSRADSDSRWRLAFEHLEQAAHIVGEVVEPDPEIPLGFGAEYLIEFAHLAGLRIDLEELVSEQWLQ